MRFSLPSIKCSTAPPSLRPLACGNQIAVHSSDSEAVLGSSRKLGEAAEHLIDGRENAFVGRLLNFRVRMLLKSAVKLSRTLIFNKNYLRPASHGTNTVISDAVARRRVDDTL